MSFKEQKHTDLTKATESSPRAKGWSERWSDFHPLSYLQREVDDIFSNFFREVNPRQYSNKAVFKPSIDVVENDKSYNLTVEVPGVEEKDIELSVSNNTLVVRGEKKSEKEDKQKHYHYSERFYGSFYRSMTLPDDADANKIDAKFKNGILEITIQKAPNKGVNEKRIEIKKGS